MSGHRARVAGLLTSVSLATLSFLNGRGTALAAGGTTLKGSGSKTISTNFDYVNIEAPADYTLVVNNATISPGFSNPQFPNHAVSVWVSTAATVGQLVNNQNIVAIDNAIGNNPSTDNAQATGLLINGTVPLVTNNGLIQGSAYAHRLSSSGTAVALALGIAGGTNTVNNGQILAYAKAFASAPAAVNARVEATGIFQESGKGSLSVTNSTGHRIAATASAFASASTGYARACACAHGIHQFVAQTGTGLEAAAVVANSGNVVALAVATAKEDALATAHAVGVSQVASNAPIVVDLVTNSGSIQGIAKASAFATGTHSAGAFASGIGVKQHTFGADLAYQTVNNSGSIRGQATAFASATSGYAGAGANAFGVEQSGYDATVSNATVNNSSSGVITAFAHALAIGSTDETVHASASAYGVQQRFEGGKGGVVNLAVTNSGAIGAQALAAAGNACSEASARAHAFGVYQGVEDGSYVSEAVTNNTGGHIFASAAAAAFAASGEARASAYANGVHQGAEFAEGVNFLVVNNGSIAAHATAIASAPHSSEEACAHAQGSGVNQQGLRNEGFAATVTNNAAGVIDGVARALAYGNDRALATAYAAGVGQSGYRNVSSNFSVVNSGRIAAHASALAVSKSGEACAHAFAVGVYQSAVFSSEEGSAVTASLTNNSSGIITAQAKASAFGGSGLAAASARAFGVSQYAFNMGAVSFTVNNSGKIAASAVAYADPPVLGSVHASAHAIGVLQNAVHSESESSYAGAAFTASVSNSGNISANAIATAVGDAIARATAVGVSQYAVNFAQINMSVVNSGKITANAAALAVATTGNATAEAHAFGLFQFGSVFGSMNAVASNLAHGFISAQASAHASAMGHSGKACATAHAFAVSQNAFEGGLAHLTIHNSGNIQALAAANALSLGSDAEAEARASGAFQCGGAIGGLTATVTNDAGGSIYAAARALAVARFAASAIASAYGVRQEAEDDVGFASLTTSNNGFIGALAQAGAYGSCARAGAVAAGVVQHFENVDDAVATVSNGGTIDVKALARAAGPIQALACASAAGIAVTAYDVTAPLNISITNSGDIHAVAKAVAVFATVTNHAVAGAVGIFVKDADGPLDFVEGTIKNSGHIWASAFANAASGYAGAVGIYDPSSINDTTITNTGLINAYAQTPNGGVNGGILAAFATGILISGVEGIPVLQLGGIDPPPGLPPLTVVVNDGGTIWAGISRDGGNSIARGNAINTLGNFALDIPAAPNAVSILLEGTSQPGHIFGDILIGGADQIDVLNGKTFFDGILNNPTKGTDLTEEEIQPTPGYPFAGRLNIDNGGKFVLCQSGWSGACDSGAAAWADAGPGGAGFDPAKSNNGPAYAFTNAFAMTSGATIAYQLTPRNGASNYTGVFTSPGSVAPGTPFVAGTYSQLFANTASLNGTFNAEYLPGFYADSTTYKHVIEAGNVTGGFSSITDNSVLLNTMLDVHDGSPGFVNLITTRTAFGAVPGLTHNESAAGGGIESVFGQLPSPGTNPATTNAFDQLVANLFTIDNTQQYAQALDQLSGAQYAQQLQSVIWSTRELDQTITDRMECQIGGESWTTEPSRPGRHAAAATPGCFQPGHWTLWGQVHGSWDHQNGDANAPGYNENQVGAYVGADYVPVPDWYIGAAGGYFSSNMNFANWGGVSGGSIRYDGFQIAGYGGYDNRVWYARGILAYGNYTGDSTRYVSVTGSPVDPHGTPDAGVLSFYGEAGRRFLLAQNWTATPFVGLGVANGWLDGFTESDASPPTGANLTIGDSSGTSVASRLGVRVSTMWGKFEPEASLAWQHEFGDTTQTVNMSFASAPAGANFSVISANVGRDGADVEAGLSYNFNAWNKVSVLYDGFFTDSYYANAVVGRWTAKW